MSHYKQDHLIAKLIVACVVTLLLYIDGSFTLLQCLAVFVWFFGINITAYVVEHVRKHPHRHDKI